MQRRRRGLRKVPPFFSGAGGKQAMLLNATNRALRRTSSATLRAEAGQRRTDSRAWVVDRRARTRQLIELGGLVQKAGLVDLTGDDRAAIYGAMLEAAARVRGDGREDVMTLWRRRGGRAFEIDQKRG